MCVVYPQRPVDYRFTMNVFYFVCECMLLAWSYFVMIVIFCIMATVSVRVSLVYFHSVSRCFFQLFRIDKSDSHFICINWCIQNNSSNFFFVPFFGNKNRFKCLCCWLYHRKLIELHFFCLRLLLFRGLVDIMSVFIKVKMHLNQLNENELVESKRGTRVNRKKGKKQQLDNET